MTSAKSSEPTTKTTVSAVGHTKKTIVVDTDLAIIGIGSMFPDASDTKEYWNNIKLAKDAIRPIPVTHWKPEHYFDNDPKKPDHTYGQQGGFLKPYPFNPIEFGLAPNDIEATDTSQILGMVVAHEALKDAGYGPDRDFDRDRVGCIMGVTGTLELVIPLGARLGHPIWREALKDAGVPKDIADDVVQRISESYVGWQENSFPGLLGNVVAGRIAQRLNLGGTNTVVDAACASSISSIHLAAMELMTGRADMMITGGVDTFNDIFMYMCFSKTPALSASGHARPFSNDSDGTVLGEGVGTVILKRLADAERDGDKIYAVLKGIGTSSDGKGQAIYAPSAKGQKKALRRAYELAGVTPAQIDLVEGHGTGTKVGDAVELTALTEVYKESMKEGQEPWVTLGSVKSQIGHAKAAAGVAGVIKAVMALHYKVLPPTIKVNQPQSYLLNSPFFLSSQARPWIKANGEKRRAAVSAFGFGGSNFHCVVEEYSSEAKEIHGDHTAWVWPFAATNTAGIIAEINSVLGQTTSTQKLRGLSKSLCTKFSSTASCRLVAVSDATVESAKAILTKALEQLSKESTTAKWSTPDGIYFSHQPAAGKLAILFPGQGSQYVGMHRRMAVSHPAWITALTAAATAKSSVTNSSTIADRIYPREVVTALNQASYEAALRATEVAQPAIGAMSAAAWMALKEFGLKPDMVAGHSYGELTALYAAGVFDLESFAYLSQSRGDVMASLSGDLGTMLAVSGDRKDIEALLAKDKVDVVVANHNSPKQVVLSGTVAGIEHAAQVLSAAKITNKRLNVGAAFHSPLVAPAEIPFSECVKKVKWQQPRCVVYSNTTAKPYPETAVKCQKTLSRQLACGVAFVDQISAMYDDGARVFLEVGPAATLTGLAKSILAERQDVSCVALDSSAGKRDGFVDMVRLLAEVASLGLPVNLAAWDHSFVAGRDDQEASKCAMPITGANYRKPTTKRPPVAERIYAPTDVSAPSREVPASMPKPVMTNHVMAKPVTTQPVMTNPVITNPVITNPVMKPIVQDNRMKEPTMNSKTPAPAFAPQAPVAMEALSYVQESFLALQRMQQENASLHRQFLENQAASQAMFHRLMSDQQQLMVGQPVAAYPQQNLQAAPQARMMIEAPVYQAPVYQAPVVAQPTPVYQAPVYQAPVKASPAAVSPVASVTSTSTNSAAKILVSIIAEKTGYPESMLELTMSLESDLGIDSIKRVEIFAALQDLVPEAASLKPDEMTQLRTLGDIVTRLTPAAGAVIEAPRVQAKAVSASSSSHLKTIMAIVAEKTGYPIEMLTPEMALESDLGIDSIKRVEIFADLQERIPQASLITHEHMGSLATLAAISDFLNDASGTSASAAAQPGASATVSGSTTNNDQTVVTAAVMATIAEKTGYPTDMLTLDMELESDLGIDSIKRVEIFAAFQDRWPAQAGADAAVLGSLRTLREIVSYFGFDGSNDQGTEGALKKKTFQAVRNTEQSIERFELIPVALVDSKPQLPINFEDLDTVWVVTGPSALGDGVVKRLKQRGMLVSKVSMVEALTKDLPTVLNGVLFLLPEPATEAEHSTEHSTALLAAIQEAYVQNVFLFLQRAASSLQQAGKLGRASIASVTYLGGRFALDGLKQRELAYGAGVAGLIKTVGHEWPEVNAKALDLAPESLANVAKTAEGLISEWSLRGAAEVGIDADGVRWGLGLKKTLVMGTETNSTPEATEKGAPWIISGGARGVTAAVAVALAEVSEPTLVILGRSEMAASEPAWACGATTSAELQKNLLAAGGQWTPKTAKEAVSKVLNEREINSNLQMMRDAGATVVYRSVDVRDAGAVGLVVQEIRQKFGPIRGLIHGAGVLTDKWLVEKTLPQFQAVYDTKIRGAEALFGALEGHELRYCLLFSSSTGRFGRKGQCDYAVANEVLNKLAQHYGQIQPQCRSVAVNWGPWDGGMVTSELKKLFASEGIAVIPVVDGAQYVINELHRNQTSAKEVVILGKPPETTEPKKLQAFTISVPTVPILRDHVMNGKGVVPAALMMEWLAQSAVYSMPGLVMTGLSDFKVLKGIVLRAEESLNLEVLGAVATIEGKFTDVQVTLCSTTAGKLTRHASARVRLADSFQSSASSKNQKISKGTDAYPQSVAKAYHTDLFHGPALHGVLAIDGIDASRISASVKTGPSPSEWMTHPLRERWLADPLVIDCAFQLMILWSKQFKGAAALPCAVGIYEQYQASFPLEGVTIRAQITENGATKFKATMEFRDASDGLIARLENYEGIVDAGLQQTFQKNDIHKSNVTELH